MVYYVGMDRNKETETPLTTPPMPRGFRVDYAEIRFEEVSEDEQAATAQALKGETLNAEQAPHPSTETAQLLSLLD
jgi:hypothetical protein